MKIPSVKIPAVLALALVVASCVVIPKKPDPSAAGLEESAKGLYSKLIKLKISGLPSGAKYAAIKPLITPALAEKIAGAKKEQAAFVRKHPDEKPPWIEGDLFSSLFEGPQNFQIRDVAERGDHAEVLVYLQYSSDGQNVRWKDILIFKKARNGWLLDDIRYGGSWPFAPKGTLSSALVPGS